MKKTKNNNEVKSTNVIRYGEKPPNYEKVCQHFDVEDNKSVIFTYHPHIYVPYANTLADELVIHENTHLKQQEAMGVEAWWNKYYEDADFRLAQEIEAYRRQYKYAKLQNRELAFRQLLSISQALSSEIYGNIISQQDAMQIIKKGQ